MALATPRIKYSPSRNWYTGDQRTGESTISSPRRGDAAARRSRFRGRSRDRSAITWNTLSSWRDDARGECDPPPPPTPPPPRSPCRTAIEVTAAPKEHLGRTRRPNPLQRHRRRLLADPLIAGRCRARRRPTRARPQCDRAERRGCGGHRDYIEAKNRPSSSTRGARPDFRETAFLRMQADYAGRGDRADRQRLVRSHPRKLPRVRSRSQKISGFRSKARSVTETTFRKIKMLEITRSRPHSLRRRKSSMLT